MSRSTGDTSLRDFYIMTLGRPTAKLFNLCWYSIKGELCCRHSIGFHNLTLTWVKWCKIAIVSRTNLFKGNARVLKKWHKILKQIACFLCRLDLKVPIIWNLIYHPVQYITSICGDLCARLQFINRSRIFVRVGHETTYDTGPNCPRVLSRLVPWI